MNGGTSLTEKLRRLLGKMLTLRDSCRGIAGRRRCPDLTWFEGAAAICDEALTCLQEVIHRLEKCKE
jgi:hypothetical protein